jgi:hypothetical protein
MSKLKVPHCKECLNYRKEISNQGKNYWHWCNHEKNYDSEKNYDMSRNINFQELKTSPEWCPKRFPGKKGI